MYEGNIEDFVLKRHLGFYRGLMGLFHESFHVYQVCICEFSSILLATPGSPGTRSRLATFKKGFLRLAPHGQSDQSPLREGKKGEREERKRKERKERGEKKEERGEREDMTR